MRFLESLTRSKFGFFGGVGKMKQLNIKLNDEVFELVRKLCFEKKMKQKELIQKLIQEYGGVI
jgi:hypothetical protein